MALSGGESLPPTKECLVAAGVPAGWLIEDVTIVFSWWIFSPPKLGENVSCSFWGICSKGAQKSDFWQIKKSVFSSGSWLTHPGEATYVPDAGILALLSTLSKYTNWTILLRSSFWQREERRFCQDPLSHLSPSQKCVPYQSALLLPRVSTQGLLPIFHPEKQSSAFKRDLRGAPSIN